MTYIETNIFPITNLRELNFRYDTYRVWNLRREQDEYFQNRDNLVRDLSFRLRAPVQIIERNDGPYLVVPESVTNVPDSFQLVRNYVRLERAASALPLDFSIRVPENDAICLRFIQFMLQAPLWRDARLWQTSPGMAFFEKTPVDQENGIGRYRGFAVRAVVTPSGGIGLCVDIHSKYVQTTSLPVHINRLTFRQYQGQRCIYRYGHDWYEIRIEALGDVSVSEEQIRTPEGPVSLLDFVTRACRKPLPVELANLAHDAAVVRYRNKRGEDRTAPAGLCYPVRDNQRETARRLYGQAIMPPHIRRQQIHRYVDQYLTELNFGGVTLHTARRPERIERRVFTVPDFEFGQERKLSVRGTEGASQVTLDDLGQQRLAMLRDVRAGFFVREAFRRQYLILPQSVWESWGEQFLVDLKRTVNGLYPEGGGYEPEVITYKDRGPRTYRDQGKAIIESICERFMEPAYALVMLHHTNDRAVRQHDLLAAMVIRELRNKDIYAAVNHSAMGEQSYTLVTDADGAPHYKIRH